mgnify:CR=1 FL=1
MSRFPLATSSWDAAERAALQRVIDGDRFTMGAEVAAFEADFARFAGEQAKIKTRLPIDGQKNFIGRIEGCSNDIVRISFDGKSADIELSNIDKARLKPEFKFNKD